MSRVLFNTIDGEASITHSERTYMDRFCGNLSITNIMDKIDYDDLEKTSEFLKFSENHWFLKYFNNDEYGIAFERDRDIRLILRDFSGVSSEVQIYDEVLNEWSRPWIYNLNQALRIGNEVVHIMARIHAQCEIHGYITSANYDWFKNVIKKGLETKLLRDKIKYESDGKLKEWSMGWDSVIKLIEETKGNEMVMSFTVCDEFPNIGLMGEKWYDLKFKEQWNVAWDKISKDKGLSIKPDDLEEFYFKG